MPRRTGAVHVATVRSTSRDRVYETTLLRRTYREDGKVKHETLGNISHLPPHVIEMIRGSLQGQIYVPVSESFEVVRNRPHGHVAAALGTLRKIGLWGLLAKRPPRDRETVGALA